MRLVRSPIARLRQRAGFSSARTAAARLKVHPKYLLNIERGSERPSAALFARVAALYGLEAAALVILFEQTAAELRRRNNQHRKELANNGNPES